MAGSTNSSILNYDKFTLLYGMFNEFVFPEAKMNIDKLKLYYKQDAYSANNSLIQRLLRVIDTYKFEDITEGSLRLELTNDGKTVDECNNIIKAIKDYKSYSKGQVNGFREGLKQLCYSAYITNLNQKYAGDPVGFVEASKKFEYLSNYSDTMIIKDFGDLNIVDIVQDYCGEGYKSSFDFVNDSYPIGGYVPGQIVAVCGAPGNGKSLFLQNEAVNFIKNGHKVHYLALGDLNELDFVIRMTAMYLNVPMREVTLNIIPYYEQVKSVFKDKLFLTVVPSGTVRVTDYVDYIKRRSDEFDILMIDYDSNFARDPNLSMYDLYGDTYDKLTELSRMRKLVFVACQPKQCYWRDEVLPLEALGESSRKQHIIDMMIGIGKNPNSRIRMGKFSIPKNRRGTPGVIKPWIASSEGKFYSCSEMLYAKYRSNTSYKYSPSWNVLQMEDIDEDDETPTPEVA